MNKLFTSSPKELLENLGTLIMVDDAPRITLQQGTHLLYAIACSREDGINKALYKPVVVEELKRLQYDNIQFIKLLSYNHYDEESNEGYVAGEIHLIIFKHKPVALVYTGEFRDYHTLSILDRDVYVAMEAELSELSNGSHIGEDVKNSMIQLTNFVYGKTTNKDAFIHKWLVDWVTSNEEGVE